MTTPDPVYLFRMVHWHNIEYILTNGLCCKHHKKVDHNYISIGHQQLILDSEEYIIPIDGYGTLGDYIPFYFWGHSPMLYMIAKGLQFEWSICYLSFTRKHDIKLFFSTSSPFDERLW